MKLMALEPSRIGGTSSAGHILAAPSYLDARFLAAQTEYEEMLRWVGIEKSWQVLDAGSGSGAFLPLLCELVGADGSVCELDLAPENAQACQTRLRDLEPECQAGVLAGDLFRLPFGEATFDAVWCANTTQYWTDDELSAALSEFKRVTRRGGLVAVKDADATCFQLAHIDPAATWRYLDSARGNVPQVAGVMRAIELPLWFRRAGLIDVRAKTTIMARFGPLKPVEIAALGPLIRHKATEALTLDQPERDTQAWQQLLLMLEEGHLFDRPGFLIREGAIVVVGEVQ